MSRRQVVLALSGLFLLGCSHVSSPPAQPAVIPPATPPRISSPPAPSEPPLAALALTVANEAPIPIISTGSDDLQAALRGDQSTFEPEADTVNRQPNFNTPPLPQAPQPDALATLRTIGASLAKGDDPAGLQNPAAAYVATMAPGVYVYNLGPGPNARHEVEPYHRVFRLQQKGAAWEATQICTRSSESVQVWLATGPQPVVICDAWMGQGKPYLYSSLYRGTTEILAVEHMVAQPGALVIAGPRDGTPDLPPDIQVVQSADFFGYGRTSDYLKERLTLSWRDDAYRISQREWLGDWSYHVTRFLELISAGDYDRATQELTFQPEGGLQAYLNQHAHRLERYQGRWAWPRRNLEGHGFWISGVEADEQTSPWFWFDLAPDGRIAGIGMQLRPPQQ